jgi:hypothetical protein
MGLTLDRPLLRSRKVVEGAPQKEIVHDLDAHPDDERGGSLPEAQ